MITLNHRPSNGPFHLPRDWLLGLAAIVGIIPLVGGAVLTVSSNQAEADVADNTELDTKQEPTTLIPRPVPLGVPGQPVVDNPVLTVAGGLAGPRLTVLWYR